MRYFQCLPEADLLKHLANCFRSFSQNLCGSSRKHLHSITRYNNTTAILMVLPLVDKRRVSALLLTVMNESSHGVLIIYECPPRPPRGSKLGKRLLSCTHKSPQHSKDRRPRGKQTSTRIQYRGKHQPNGDKGVALYQILEWSTWC